MLGALAVLLSGCAVRHQFVQAPACPGEEGAQAYHLLEVAPYRKDVPLEPAPRADAAPQVALGVARPSVCNDYPVSYRVIQPDTVARVRSVEQFTVRTAPP